jgi:hypothetical protein
MTEVRVCSPKMERGGTSEWTEERFVLKFGGKEIKLLGVG